MNYQEFKSICNEEIDNYDLWGSAMNLTFDICDYCTLQGYGVPHELGYSPSILGPNLEGCRLIPYFDQTNERDINKLLKVLNRYIDRLKYLELDY